jgi:hypothetical protein
LPQPWSRRLGQLVYLPKLAAGDPPTRGVFEEEPVIERLALGREPLEGIGAQLTERVVEIPWVFRCLTGDQELHILDIGTAFSPMVYKWLLVRLPHVVEVADLNETALPGIRSHVADVRNLPFAERSFDVAICVSTLEHVGMDNANYKTQSGGAGQADALRELGRVARRVLVTVPAGCDADKGSFHQYAPATFRGVVDEAGLVVDRLEVFAHDPVRGWAPAAEDSVQGLTYQQGAVAAAAVICAELSARDNGAARQLVAEQTAAGSE